MFVRAINGGVWQTKLLRISFLISSQFALFGGSIAASGEDPAESSSLALGKELFEHEWQPNDPRSHAGDGLGPLFNGRSCAGCHSLGGVGGAGPANKNVETLAFRSRLARLRSLEQPAAIEGDEAKQKEGIMAGIHPGLRSAPTTVLHLYGTDASYSLWRAAIAGVAGRARRSSAREPEIASWEQRVKSQSLREQLDRHGISLMISQRNTTAIFGAGIIDSIAADVIEAVAEAKKPNSSKVRGRVARLPDGRIGRFGWKAQMPSLDDFTRAACAMELGLEVPLHSQTVPNWDINYSAPGLDLSEPEVQSLIHFVRSLPAPKEQIPDPAKADEAVDRSVDVASLVQFLRDGNPVYRRAAAQALQKRGEGAAEAVPALQQAINDRDAGVADAAGRALVAVAPMSGRELFDRLDCAACHMPKLGAVEGIYSDLLLHDLGRGLADNAEYYGVPSLDSSPGNRSTRAKQSPSDGDQNDAPPQKAVAPAPQEWRTPPLWGCRDSAPYLHDGRAATLEAAIHAHDGEAAESRNRFTRLSVGEQLLLTTYLKTLGVPKNSPTVWTR